MTKGLTMLKKIILSGAVLLMAGCSLFGTKQSPIPAEYAQADYLLSDADAQRWVFASKQAEQCIYPNLTRILQQHFPKEDAYIHSQYIFFYPLENIIGEKYVKIIQEDEKSMSYATYQYKKFKQDKVEDMDKAQCDILRKNALDDLEVVKGQYRNGMIEVQKNPDGTIKSTDGVATNQNKFFFDIIKWGSALLL
jgi:naphthoate synthase